MNFSLAEADWGIEEPASYRKRFDSVSTSEFSQPAKIRDPSARSPSLGHRSSSFGFGSDTYRSNVSISDDHPKSRYAYNGIDVEVGHPKDCIDGLTIAPTTENFQKYILKYLNLKPQRTQFVEKFKYNLVLSNLLDDSLVLSKNEHALNNLLLSRQSEDRYISIKKRNGESLDKVSLKICNRKYELHLPKSLDNPLLLVNTISLIIFLMKSGRGSHNNMHRDSRINLFSILLIVSTSVLRCKRVRATIESTRSLRRLDDFMISNCYINKVLIGHMISIKEIDMFSFLKQESSRGITENPESHIKALKSHINTLLTCLILNLKHSIREILPISNGDLLEKYCLINNVHVSNIYEGMDPSSEEALTIEMLTAKLAIFNAHRRFLICQLLTIHESHVHNFFLLTLCDQYRVNVEQFPKYVSPSRKAAAIDEMFKTHTKILDQLLSLNKKFKELYKHSQPADYANDDMLQTQNTHNTDLLADKPLNSDFELDCLVDKLENVVASLKHFKKYTQSISGLDNVEEHEERLEIFRSLQGELQTCVDVSGHCMSAYSADFSAKFQNASDKSAGSISQRNSQSDEPSFNLKAFRTLSESSKSRMSLSSEKHHSSHNDHKRSQRASGGLQLGVLAVTGDTQKRAINNRRESSGGKETSRSNRGSYNQAALEALTKKSNVGYSANRFSMASVNSNVSGFSDYIASTQITTDEDDGEPRTNFLSEGEDRGMSKAELAVKLEESLARIYNLESENQNLKCKTSLSETEEELNIPETEESFACAVKDTQFLENLENRLSSKTR